MSPEKEPFQKEIVFQPAFFQKICQFLGELSTSNVTSRVKFRQADDLIADALTLRAMAMVVEAPTEVRLPGNFE